MVKANTKFLTFFLLLMLNLFSCNNTLAYHIFVHAREISEKSRSICLEHKNGNKVLETIYRKLFIPATEEEKEFCNKVHGKVIKDNDDLYSEMLDLCKKVNDIEDQQGNEIYEGGLRWTRRHWKKSYDILYNCKKRINEILHSLVK